MKNNFLLLSLLSALIIFFLLKDQLVTAGGGYFTPSERDTIHRLLQVHNEEEVKAIVGARLREFDVARNASTTPTQTPPSSTPAQRAHQRRLRLQALTIGSSSTGTGSSSSTTSLLARRQRLLRATTGSASSSSTGSSSSSSSSSSTGSSSTGSSGSADSSSGSCSCRCNAGNLDFVNPTQGYGKYCGAGYGCDSGDDGCDPLDNCCAAHDECVGRTGYCDSCECNIVLANCAARVSGRGFSPCNKQQQALDSLLDDICTAIKFAPNSCGGCESELTPDSCDGFPI